MKRKHRKYTDKEKAAVMEALKTADYREVAKKFKIPAGTVWSWATGYTPKVKYNGYADKNKEISRLNARVSRLQLITQALLSIVEEGA